MGDTQSNEGYMSDVKRQSVGNSPVEEGDQSEDEDTQDGDVEMQDVSQDEQDEGVEMEVEEIVDEEEEQSD